jgi:hypothetical protein
MRCAVGKMRHSLWKIARISNPEKPKVFTRTRRHWPVVPVRRVKLPNDYLDSGPLQPKAILE